MHSRLLSARLRLPVCLVVILIFTGCGGGKAATGETEGNVDGKSTLADIGADIGCGIATLIRKDCASGAEVGVKVADKIISWVFRSLKIADAKTVNEEYKAREILVSKKEVAAKAFTTNVQTVEEPNAGKDGKTKPQTMEVRVTSTSDLVGYGDKIPAVTQTYALYDDKNKLISSKTERVAAVDGAGRYETDAKFKVAKTSANKQYRVETSLVVDGKTYKKNSYKVAFDDNSRVVLAWLEQDLRPFR